MRLCWEWSWEKGVKHYKNIVHPLFNLDQRISCTTPTCGVSFYVAIRNFRFLRVYQLLPIGFFEKFVKFVNCLFKFVCLNFFMDMSLSWYLCFCSVISYRDDRSFRPFFSKRSPAPHMRTIRPPCIGQR
jgi:hypothetical protein